MIQANELRIGNWILVNGKSGPLSKQEMIALCDKWGNDYEPIPLTLELLERCGFEEKVNINEDQDEIYYYRHRELFDLKWKDGDLSFDFWTLQHIKYLHQLQNLYFALTGNELEVQIK